MSKTPTPTAVAGKFQSNDGSDLVQYLNPAGEVVLWVDCNGDLHIKGDLYWTLQDGEVYKTFHLTGGPGDASNRDFKKEQMAFVVSRSTRMRFGHG